MMFAAKLAWSSLLIAVMLTTTAVTGWARHCSLATLKGSYGALDQGTVLAPIPGLPTPPFSVAITGLVIYDGAGHLSGTATASFGGVVLPGGTFTGTYTVGPDCTYSDEFATSLGIAFHHAGTITGEGMFQEIHYVYTDPGAVSYGTAKKTPPGGCSLKTIKGSYAVFGQGTITVPPSPPVPVAEAGMFTADGAGHFSGEVTESVNGAITKDETFTGNYPAINPDCTVSVVITTASGLVVHEAGTITGVGKFQEINGIVTDPGWVFAETAKKQ